jgi:long-chain acyl-CoA synthetase
MGLAVARERKVWTRTRLTDLGIERAEWWGWPNIYTYTKSLGEQLVAAETGIVRSIVRPSIVESAKDFPFPGWNEGFTTTAPLIFIALKGQTQIPVNERLILDITPVDQVAAVMLAVAAEACVEEPRLVYQAATGDSNPNDMRRIVGLLGLYKRQHFDEKETGFKIVNQIASQMEARPVTTSRFEKTSTPMINAAAKGASSLLDRVRPRWGGGRITEFVDHAKKHVERLEELTHETKEAFEMFRPFMVENAYIFRADNVRSLFSRIRADEQTLLPWHPEKFDWYDYWMNVHFPASRNGSSRNSKRTCAPSRSASIPTATCSNSSRLRPSVTRRASPCGSSATGARSNTPTGIYRNSPRAPPDSSPVRACAPATASCSSATTRPNGA